MRIIAFDSTGPILTVGAAHDARTIGRKDVRSARGMGNLLDRLIDGLLGGIGWTRSDVEGLGLLTGPGSLTATRLGWATAAGWSQAAGIPVTGWTVPEAHRHFLRGNASGAVCCVHYRGDTFLLYDLDSPDNNPRAAYLTAETYAERPPRLLTGPGVIGRRESWLTYCGPLTRIADESEAIIGGDTLAVWAEEYLLEGKSLSLTSSPLEYGIPPDFKKLTPA